MKPIEGKKYKIKYVDVDNPERNAEGVFECWQDYGDDTYYFWSHDFGGGFFSEEDIIEEVEDV